MLQRGVKRVFDLVAASLAMIASLPLWPLIMLAIYLEDGRPFFFAHRRETLGGREFPCWKFRSMRKDAEEIKQRIMLENQVDGPQFYIDDDPRITRVGRFLRKTQLDELPQLLNVILGHMSIVGPRPSPHKENQYCPAWRETRLSVRPGITGLWQVKRTREEGLDFQEWIRYDIEYVENASFGLDLKIISPPCASFSDSRRTDAHRETRPVTIRPKTRRRVLILLSAIAPAPHRRCGALPLSPASNEREAQQRRAVGLAATKRGELHAASRRAQVSTNSLGGRCRGAAPSRDPRSAALIRAIARCRAIQLPTGRSARVRAHRDSRFVELGRRLRQNEQVEIEVTRRGAQRSPR